MSAVRNFLSLIVISVDKNLLCWEDAAEIEAETGKTSPRHVLARSRKTYPLGAGLQTATTMQAVSFYSEGYSFTGLS